MIPFQISGILFHFIKAQDKTNLFINYFKYLWVAINLVGN